MDNRLLQTVHTLNASLIHRRGNKYPSVPNQIFLASGSGTVSGDNNVFVHYCSSGFILLGLDVLREWRGARSGPHIRRGGPNRALLAVVAGVWTCPCPWMGYETVQVSWVNLHSAVFSRAGRDR